MAIVFSVAARLLAYLTFWTWMIILILGETPFDPRPGSFGHVSFLPWCLFYWCFSAILLSVTVAFLGGCFAKHYGQLVFFPSCFVCSLRRYSSHLSRSGQWGELVGGWHFRRWWRLYLQIRGALFTIYQIARIPFEPPRRGKYRANRRNRRQSTQRDNSDSPRFPRPKTETVRAETAGLRYWRKFVADPGKRNAGEGHPSGKLACWLASCVADVVPGLPASLTDRKAGAVCRGAQRWAFAGATGDRLGSLG